MRNRRSLRILLISSLAIATLLIAVSTGYALNSVNPEYHKPKVIWSENWGTYIDSGFGDWEGLIATDVETDKYENKDVKELVDKVNDGDNKTVEDIIKFLPQDKKKSNIEEYPTTNGYDVNLKLYDRVSDFYELRYYKDGHLSNVAPGKVKVLVPDTKGMKGEDLLVMLIDTKTGEIHLIAPTKFNSEEGIMTLDVPCVGAFCILHKIPIVVRNVDPDLYPNKTLTSIIKAMPDNETMECEYFLQKTLEKKNVDELEVDEGVTIKTEDYSSAIALSDVAVHLGEDEKGEDHFSYDLVTRFKANLYRANDKVNWERMLKYENIKYDRSAILKDDKELTKIEPFVLEDSFLYHIDAVTREVSIIYEPSICWSTYGELTKEKEKKIEKDDIQFFDVDDIDGQELQDKKLVLDETDKEEIESSALIDELLPTAYAADTGVDVDLDVVDEDYNQAYDEDDVCLVINGDKYLGMGPFLVFMPKKEHKFVFPWWILLILAAAGGGYAYYRKNKKKERESE